jgi:hypothetical protein
MTIASQLVVKGYMLRYIELVFVGVSIRSGGRRFLWLEAVTAMTGTNTAVNSPVKVMRFPRGDRDEIGLC